MSLLKLKLSQTQSLALRLLHDPTVVELLFWWRSGWRQELYRLYLDGPGMPQLPRYPDRSRP